MKTVLVIALVVATTFANVHEEFEAFKEKFGKNYNNPKEEAFRKAVFMKNQQTINEHNKKYDSGESTYTLEMNHMGDLLLEEALNCVLFHNKTESFPLHRSDSDIQLPESVDWREKGYVTPVKDQGYCGSCWAFSTTGAIEGQWAKKTGQLLSLSEEQLVDCDPNDLGCDGGWPSAAMSYLQKNNGIDSEKQYPYTAISGYGSKCQNIKADNNVKLQSVIEIAAGDEKALKDAVSNVGPISVAIGASSNFHLYKKGVFHDKKCNFQNHAVLIVGYGTDPQGGDYWLVKNSWGGKWGEQGYIRMSRGSNMCNIANSAVYPVV